MFIAETCFRCICFIDFGMDEMWGDRSNMFEFCVGEQFDETVDDDMWWEMMESPRMKECGAFDELELDFEGESVEVSMVDDS